MTLPTDLPARLRKHGLKVVEIDGWKTRGRPASTGGFAPVGVLCHHTASSANGRAAIPLLVGGRSDLPGPLCQLSLDRQGVVYIVAAGRANHAGVARPSGTVAGGDGNVLYIGIEAQNEGTGEHWPKAQYDAYVKLAAALCVEITGNSAQTVRAHKETSITGKIDPAGPTPYEAAFDMDKFRARVAKLLPASHSSKPKPKPKPKPSRHERVKARRRRFLLGRGKRGLKRPRHLVVRVANCASVSTGPKKAEDTFRRALTTPGKFGLPDVVLCQEMSDVDAKAVCHEVGGWDADQYGPLATDAKTGGPDSGLAIAYRTDRAHRLASKLQAGAPATREGGGVRKRPVLTDQLIIDRGTSRAWTQRFASGHADPSRAPRARETFINVFRRVGAPVKGGDMNVPGKIARTLFRRRVLSIGVLHLVLARWIPAQGPEPVDHGSDHKGVDVLLWP